MCSAKPVFIDVIKKAKNLVDLNQLVSQEKDLCQQMPNIKYLSAFTMLPLFLQAEDELAFPDLVPDPMADPR